VRLLRKTLAWFAGEFGIGDSCYSVLRPGIFSLLPFVAVILNMRLLLMIRARSSSVSLCVVNPGWGGGSFYLDEYLSSAAKANLWKRVPP
jgi:hypothetical protein